MTPLYVGHRFSSSLCVDMSSHGDLPQQLYQLTEVMDICILLYYSGRLYSEIMLQLSSVEHLSSGHMMTDNIPRISQH